MSAVKGTDDARWTRLVIRPDAVTRFWCIGGLQAGPAYARAVAAPVFEEATFTSHLFLGNGATHVRIDEMRDLHRRFMLATEEDPTVPQRLARHFVSVGEEWVRYCEENLRDRALLDRLEDEELASRLERFCSLHSGYAPALYLPFMVERLYAERFPGLLARIAGGLREAVGGSLRSAGGPLADYFGQGLVDVAPIETIERAIQPIVEHTSRRTHAERKEEALNGLARAIGAELGPEEAASASVESLERAAPELGQRLGELEAEFGWIGQWGYPPRYAATTKEELLGEVLVRLRKGPTSETGEEKGERLSQLLDAAAATEEERSLISDFAYYNFYRTYRMELLIRAQYLSVPLFDAIGDRLGLSAAEWSLLAPPELQEALTGGVEVAALRRRSASRQDGWLLRTDGLRGERQLLDGDGFEVQLDVFSSVLRAGENAHGTVDSSDPGAVGGKAAALAKMTAESFRVPDYVVLTTNGVSLLDDPDSRSGAEVRKAFADAVAMIEGQGRLAIRSSASVEDGESHSWAGRFDSVLEVDLDGLDAAVAQVVDSARTERALDYAERIGSEGSGIKMAVIAQRLVEAEFAGVVNTSVPVDGGLGVEIEIVRGLGDKLVDGSVTPARFLVGRDGGVAHVSGEPRVDDELVAELAALASRLEQFFGRPQDVEFAVEGGEVFVVQSRPLTGPQGAATAAAAPLDGDYAEVVTGLSGYVAERVTGKVVKPARPGDAQTVEPGSVLVLAAATPIWDSVIFQSSALVTDEGGSTSHAIRVANELGIPAVVGARVATAMLEEGETVLVDTISGTNVGRVLRQSPDGK